jgi:hypothetical protein
MVAIWLLTIFLAAAAPPQGLVQMPTQAELFGSRLRLDGRTQAPVVQEILTEAQKEAGPVVQDLLTLRQEMINLELNNRAPELQAAMDKHTAAAARLATIEAQAFTRIYAELRENQHERAAEAFVIMGGLFYPPAAPSGGGGGRGRGGEQP